MLSFVRKFFVPQFDLIDTKTSDFEIIKDLFIDGVNNGSYEKSIVSDKNQFHHMIEHMTNGKHGVDARGRNAITLSCALYEKDTIGFMTMEVLFKMINREFPNYSLMARCKEKSKEMTKILHNFNFKAVSINKEDYVIYKLAKVSS